MSETDKPLDGRIALVTGASRGIGYQAALGFARAGAHVVALARTVGGLEELDDAIGDAGGTATLVPLDLKDFDAIDRLGASLNERYGRLDVLLGNAAILGLPGPVGHMQPDGFENLLAVNVTANWRLIRSLDPLLQASDAGRALFLTSGAPVGCKPFIGPYSASKAALEALVRTYAHENNKSRLCANLIDPGVLRTKMRAQYMPGEDPETLTPASAIVDTLVELVGPSTTENGRIYDFPERQWRE